MNDQASGDAFGRRAALQCAQTTHPYGWKGIAGVDQCNEEVGATAMDLLVGLLNGNRFGLPRHPRTVKLQGSWKDGETAPRKRSRK